MIMILIDKSVRKYLVQLSELSRRQGEGLTLKADCLGGLVPGYKVGADSMATQLLTPTRLLTTNVQRRTNSEAVILPKYKLGQPENHLFLLSKIHR